MVRVVVVGAGIGGLATALGLQQAGAEVVVLERADRLRPLGAGLSLFGNGLAALDALGLGSWIRAEGSTPAATLRAGQRRPDGRWLATTPAHALGDLRVVHRSVLQEQLLGGLTTGTVRCGAEVAEVAGAAGAMSVRTTAGERRAADLVVAADGVRSRVRGSWAGDPGVRYAGYCAWRGVTAVPVDLRGAAGETWGRGRRFGVAPLPDGRVYWFAVASVPPGGQDADEHVVVRRSFATWHRPIPDVVEATPAASVLRHDVHDLARPVRSFRRGGCVLLGDAAHAMTPDLGQGGNLALEDGVTLARLLAGLAPQEAPDPAALDCAVARYDEVRRPRTQAVARQARLLGRVAQARGPLAALRDGLLPLVPPAAAASRLLALQAWRPPAPVLACSDLARPARPARLCG
jgi:2-polyprenyl-6-methoxyphenol hydroxylase-like FAD-dependent oxidoreductase